MQMYWNPITKALKISNLINPTISVSNALTIATTKDINCLKLKRMIYQVNEKRELYH